MEEAVSLPARAVIRESRAEGQTRRRAKIARLADPSSPGAMPLRGIVLPVSQRFLDCAASWSPVRSAVGP